MSDVVASPSGPSTFTAPGPFGRIWRRVRLFGPWLMVVPVAGAVGWVQTFDPTSGKEGPLGPCTWHMLFGVNGPSCGGTRAFYYLIHGDLIDAVRMHLPFVLAVPFLLSGWLAWALSTVGVRLPMRRPGKRWLIAYAVFFVLFTTVLRNLPIEPFAWFDIPNTAHRLW
ncbi:DUF2752 domain-containing protein [Actinocatenispora comari]|uniref:DUF2752 domain-containing protein n=1 Tax=Actinocatenispora comari TaxID=2807577 RepID=A0A8J4EHJ8_9ACTN|nr:DUF2752 domain-containing protein [Actinocatenispora comari]GIL25087.1 hypothetical protein NUM_03420 [Actinocatenispora comari]